MHARPRDLTKWHEMKMQEREASRRETPRKNTPHGSTNSNQDTKHEAIGTCLARIGAIEPPECWWCKEKLQSAKHLYGTIHQMPQMEERTKKTNQITMITRKEGFLCQAQAERRRKSSSTYWPVLAIRDTTCWPHIMSKAAGSIS